MLLEQHKVITISSIFICFLIFLLNRKKDLHFYKNFYGDFLRYLIIEFSFFISIVIQNKVLDLISPLIRISITFCALFIYHEIKIKYNL